MPHSPPRTTKPASTNAPTKPTRTQQAFNKLSSNALFMMFVSKLTKRARRRLSASSGGGRPANCICGHFGESFCPAHPDAKWGAQDGGSPPPIERSNAIAPSIE